jgi:predicted PurR-regulated permease PerM
MGPASRQQQSEAARSGGASAVPPVLAVAAAWSWRLLAVGSVGYFLVHFLSGLTLVLVPVFLSLLLAALLHRPVGLLARVLPRWVAALLVLVLAVAVLGGVGWFVVIRIEGQYGELVAQANNVLASLRRWTASINGLGSGTLVDRATAWVQSHDSLILASAVTVGRVAIDVTTATVLTFFLTLFFLIDGARMWSWLVRLLPRPAQPATNGAGHRGFQTLSGWVTGTSLIALIHAVVIGVTLWLVGAPLVLALTVLVFIGSFVPIIGAFVFGGMAVLVTLVTGGIAPAVIVLAALLVENLLEGHVYQPLIMGRTVRLHPVAILIALAVGTILDGIVGAIIAVPVAAAVHSAVKYLTGIEDIDGHPVRDEDRMAPEPPPRALESRNRPLPH